MWYMHARLQVLAHIQPRAGFQVSSPSHLHYCLKTGSPTELKVWHWLASELLASVSPVLELQPFVFMPFLKKKKMWVLGV